MTAATRCAALLFAALLSLGTDCDEEEHDDVREALEDARLRWRAGGFPDYSLTLTHDCFCGVEGRGPVVVIVRFGEVVSRTYEGTGAPVPEDRARFFPDVEGLFDFIEDALDQDPASIRAEFHPSLGYPTLVFVDFRENVADEERGYRVTAISPLRASGAQ